MPTLPRPGRALQLLLRLPRPARAGPQAAEHGEGPTGLDWIAATGTAVASAALLVLGLVQPSPLWVQLGRVAVVFGVLGLGLAGLDLRRFVRPPAHRNAWWFSHMLGMLGSCVATVTAFSVVNFTFLPTTARWL